MVTIVAIFLENGSGAKSRKRCNAYLSDSTLVGAIAKPCPLTGLFLGAPAEK